MQLVLFCGIQATGKSTFYQQRFFHSHVRLSLDLLRTRHREQRLLHVCFETQMRCVPSQSASQPAAGGCICEIS